MRKVKNAKKDNTIKFITDLEYARAVEAAKDIAETHAEYKVLNYLACTQRLFDKEVAEILVDYSSLENKLIKEIEKKGFQEAYPEFKNAMQEADGNFLKERINVVLGYEPVFSGEIKEKFLDVLNWIPKTITRLIKYNSQFYVPTTLAEEINRKLEIALQDANKKLGYTDQAEKLFKNECILINELAARVMLVQGAIPFLEEENKELFPMEYKKDLTHLKGTLTRVKNLLGILYDYLNYGELREGELNV